MFARIATLHRRRHVLYSAAVQTQAAVVVVQTAARRHLVQRQYRRLCGGAVLVQSSARRRFVLAELQALRQTAAEECSAATLQRFMRQRRLRRNWLARARQQRLRELRERTNAKCNATIASKPVSVYLAQNSGKSWESYEAARRLKRERERLQGRIGLGWAAEAHSQTAAQTRPSAACDRHDVWKHAAVGVSDVGAPGALATWPAAPLSARSDAALNPLSYCAAPREPLSVGATPRGTIMCKLGAATVPAPLSSVMPRQIGAAIGPPSIGHSSPTRSGSGPISLESWDSEELSPPVSTEVTMPDSVLRRQSELEARRRVRGMRGTRTTNEEKYTSRVRMLLPDKLPLSPPGAILRQIAAHAESRIPVGGHGSINFRKGGRPLDIATKRGLHWQRALRDERTITVYERATDDSLAHLDGEIRAEQAAERARAQCVRIPRDGSRYKPALEIIKAARIEAAHAERGPFSYGDFEF